MPQLQQYGWPDVPLTNCLGDITTWRAESDLWLLCYGVGWNANYGLGLGGRESTWGSPILASHQAPQRICKPTEMAQPSWEYERLISSSHSLRIAFQDQLISLSEDLHADGMISNDNKTEVLNPSTSLPNRASKLVDLVTNRVKFMKEDYQTFVALLRRNQRAYKPILVIRKFVYVVLAYLYV